MQIARKRNLSWNVQPAQTKACREVPIQIWTPSGLQSGRAYCIGASGNYRASSKSSPRECLKPPGSPESSRGAYTDPAGTDPPGHPVGPIYWSRRVLPGTPWGSYRSRKDHPGHPVGQKPVQRDLPGHLEGLYRSRRDHPGYPWGLYRSRKDLERESEHHQSRFWVPGSRGLFP